MGCNLPESSLHGTSQARILEWVTIPFSRGSSRPRDQTCVSCIGRWILYHWVTREDHKEVWKVKLLICVWPFATSWTVAHQVPLSMGLPRQEYWSGLSFLSPGDLPWPRIEPIFPAGTHWQADSLPQSHLGSPWHLWEDAVDVDHRSLGSMLEDRVVVGGRAWLQSGCSTEILEVWN